MKQRVTTCLCAAMVLFARASLEAQVTDSGSVVAGSPRQVVSLDTAALHASLSVLPPPTNVKRASRVFRIDFDSTGHPRAVRPAVPRLMPERYRDAVTPLIQGALRPAAPRSGGRSVLLLVESGTPPRAEEVQLPEQPPRVANMGALRAGLQAAAQTLLDVDAVLIGTEYRVHLAMGVDEDGVGVPSGVTVSSGVAVVDSAALRAVRSIRFHPGLLDGEAVPTRVVLPVLFVFPAEP